MTDENCNFRIRRNLARIREVLWREWDPIGMKDILDRLGASGPRDEYDLYVDRIYVMLVNERRSTEDISNHLYDLASKKMGLRAEAKLRALSDQVANKLVALLPEFEAEANAPL